MIIVITCTNTGHACMIISLRVGKSKTRLQQFGLQTQGGGGGGGGGSPNEERAVGASAEISEVSDVETELFIGPPETRNKRPFQK